MNRNKVKAIQLMLNESGAGLKVDGVLGSNTREAIDNREGIQTYIDIVDKAFTDAASIKVNFKGWIPESEIREYAREAAATTGISTDTIMWMVDMESAKRKINGQTFYHEANDRGKFKGIGQLSADAWSAASKQRALDNYSVVLKPYKQGALEAKQSVFALAYYSKATEREAVDYLRRKGKPPLSRVTDSMRYAMYNQGAAGFLGSVLSGSSAILGSQSQPAIQAIKRARAEASSMVV